MSLLRSPAVNFDEKWAGLRETIGRVVKLQPVEMAKWNDHYSDIYALCEAFPVSYAERLYSETEKYLRSLVDDICLSLTNQDSRGMLASYQKHWLSYQQGAKFLHNLFSYFNRVSLKKYKMTEPDSSLEAILGGADPRTSPWVPPRDQKYVSVCVEGRCSGETYLISHEGSSTRDSQVSRERICSQITTQ
ncbi:Cullin-2 [Geodia barretti]|uniref:Cullin-2 n=1 Tax=Geodia barretti TaxID=519541 RepID=A0AA35SIU3_GEOBA|nr:Cullin-2 [Geodia barretti]